MEKTSAMISVICPKKVFETDYFYLAYHFPVVNADSIETALRSGIFFYADVMLFDCPDQEASYEDLMNKVDEVNPGIRIIANWDCNALADSSTVSRLFYCFNKPVSETDMVSIIEKAVDSNHTHEKRCEPRVTVDFPVEFFKNGDKFRANAVNLSINGMQAVIPCEKAEEELSVCRLYFGAGKGKIQFVDLNLDHKYTEKDEEDTFKVGFEFNNVDKKLKEEIYSIFTA